MAVFLPDPRHSFFLRKMLQVEAMVSGHQAAGLLLPSTLALCWGMGGWLWHGEGVGTLEPQVSPSPETARMVTAPLTQGDLSPGWTQPRDLDRRLETGISSTPLTGEETEAPSAGVSGLNWV